FATNITDRKRDEGILDQLKQSFDRIAKGDMSGLITTPFTGRYEELRQAFNLSVENVTTIIGQVKDTSRALKMATGEILSGANDLSQRTTRQAATIEETSATMEQLSRMVVENAQRADAASVKAKAVSQAATEGGDVMRRANEAMERITASSAKISNIIGLIDD